VNPDRAHDFPSLRRPVGTNSPYYEPRNRVQQAVVRLVADPANMFVDHKFAEAHRAERGTIPLQLSYRLPIRIWYVVFLDRTRPASGVRHGRAARAHSTRSRPTSISKSSISRQHTGVIGRPPSTNRCIGWTGPSVNGGKRSATVNRPVYRLDRRHATVENGRPPSVNGLNRRGRPRGEAGGILALLGAVPVASFILNCTCVERVPCKNVFAL
jgi:hypothetical protein